jgi:hypothetical protein
MLVSSGIFYGKISKAAQIIKLNIDCSKKEIISGKLSPRLPSYPFDILKYSTSSQGAKININLSKLNNY